MTHEQIEKKAATFAITITPEKEQSWEAMSHDRTERINLSRGYKQGYTDALSDAKEDAIEFLLWCQDKGYQRVRGREYWIDLKGVKMADSANGMYELYLTTKTK